MHAISQYRMIMGYADMVIWDACTAMAIWPAGMPSVLVSTHRTETYQPSSKTQSSATPSAAVSASVAAAAEPSGPSHYRPPPRPPPSLGSSHGQGLHGILHSDFWSA